MSSNHFLNYIRNSSLVQLTPTYLSTCHIKVKNARLCCVMSVSVIPSEHVFRKVFFQMILTVLCVITGAKNPKVMHASLQQQHVTRSLVKGADD